MGEPVPLWRATELPVLVLPVLPVPVPLTTLGGARSSAHHRLYG